MKKQGKEIKLAKRKLVSAYQKATRRIRSSRQAVLANRIVVATHHKTGTVWLMKIFQRICAELNLEFFSGEQQCIPDHNDVFLQDHSQVKFDELDGNCKGLHIIRDPRDRMVSGCFYHQKSDEPWLHVAKDEFDGKTYQQKINSLSSFEEQLLFEMQHAGARGLHEMLDWNYDNPNVFEVKYEDLIVDENLLLFHEIFTHLGFHGSVISDVLRIAYDNSLFSGNIKKSIHVRSGARSQWVSHFTPRVRQEFESQFPGALIKLGYEPDENWVQNVQAKTASS